MADECMKLIFIGGFGRSGSTLLGRMLGEIEGFSFIGELEYVWEQYFTDKQPCGCGAPFAECPFWEAVVEEAYGGFGSVDLDEVLDMKSGVDRMRYIPHLAFHGKGPLGLESLAEYSHLLARFYEAIKKVSGSRVVVDSSKVPAYAYTLANVPGVDLYIVHLVRDSRAVAHSWLRKKVKHEIRAEKVHMDRHGTVNSSLGWMRTHLLTEPLKFVAPRGRYIKVLYENLVEDPGRVLAGITAAIGEDDADLSFVNGRKATLGANHTIEGNPMRFERGEVELRLDDEWEKRMESADKRAVTALTWPLLMRYGYPLRKACVLSKQRNPNESA